MGKEKINRPLLMRYGGGVGASTNIDLDSTGSATFDGTVTASSNLAVTGTATVSGTFTASSSAAVTGGLTVSGTLTGSSGLAVTAASTFSGAVTVGGTLTASSSGLVSGGLTVGGTITGSSGLSVTAASTFAAGVTIGGTITASSGISASRGVTLGSAVASSAANLPSYAFINISSTAAESMIIDAPVAGRDIWIYKSANSTAASVVTTNDTGTVTWDGTNTALTFNGQGQYVHAMGGSATRWLLGTATGVGGYTLTA